MDLTMRELPVPPHFEPSDVGKVQRVPYQLRAQEAEDWARTHGLRPAAEDSFRLCLLAVDVQNTFCTPGFELFVAGRTGTAAVDDNRRLCEFIYRNLGTITQIVPSLDTHHALQLFHTIWLVDDEGNHPAPFTLVSVGDVESGRWKVNRPVVEALGIDVDYARRHLLHYTRQLAAGGKYDLTVWPYHAMVGGIGHALASAVEDAIFFHSIARRSQPNFQVKGDSPLTEHYSILGPEVLRGPDGELLGAKNTQLIDQLLRFDAIVVAGQAKSHCLAWTIDDLLADEAAGSLLAERTYLLEDCTSPIVVPGADYTDQADAAFRRYAGAGMHVVRAADPIETWPGVTERAM
jgi:nicotinamidase-related amidase